MRPEERPSGAERSAMIDRLKALGYSGQALAQMLRAGLTRREIATALIATQRQAKKKKRSKVQTLKESAG